MSNALELFHPAVQAWFRSTFPAPTRPQQLAWPSIAKGESTLLLAPTGTGKTLSAFLSCINRLMFEPVPAKRERCRVLYVSPRKALAVDIERNLRSPLVGIDREATRRGDAHHVPTLSVRTGDTPSGERARFQRAPTDILITTPESLYLLLTSAAREVLRSLDTVILDEIHALVPTKRGSHLALSLERLEVLTGRPLQRIGLSATQRPLEEIAQFLGGAQSEGKRPRRGKRAQDEAAEETVRFRPVAVVDAGARKALELRIEVPVEDMSRIGETVELPSGPAAQGPVRSSIWSAIHPRLLEHIRAHRSTLLFVNSRRVAERLAGALNELAGEVLVQAHHGSLARHQRTEIEDRLKAGQIRALVATSSLELGIDMGAIDLVIQIEAPPSVASGLQRIGRAGHQVDVPSRGFVFPKYRADLVACAAVVTAMREGKVEETRYPRNPLDILAQQIVAMASIEAWDVEELYAVVRRAAPFAGLTRTMFESVLDMLAGRYLSDDFAELKPRLTWDRIKNRVTAREGARRVAIVNGGTIPDRGLYGVFLLGAVPGKGRVGELDEEMVFETRVGETFVLGASTWRVEDITFDKVVVSPAPGQPGKMPFWHGDAPGRPLKLGKRIGKLVRDLRGMPRAAAVERLVRLHDLDEKAADNLMRYLEDQAAATVTVPDDKTLVVERTRDELGDWRICVLSPLGGKVHAPWAMAVVAKVREERGLDVETMWTDDGFVVRFPDSDVPPPSELLLPRPEELERLLYAQLGGTALFAARFRENAARALLLPKRRPGERAPLWQMRKRASDLLAVAARHSSFPIILETYRECLRDVFDVPALHETLAGISRRRIRVVTHESQTPSPFASAILFSMVAQYLYEGDAPLAERRAQALAIDHAQLRELIGDAELRELLDPDAVSEVERRLQYLDERMRARSPDSLHDLLLRLGDLSEKEIRERSTGPEMIYWLDTLVRERRAAKISIQAETRFIPVESAARYRDALGVALPPGLPQSLLEPVTDAQLEIVHRYARTHGPFTSAELAARYGLGVEEAERSLKRLEAQGRLLEGAFRPGGRSREWCDPDVLRDIRRRSLAKLRKEVEPVEPRTLARMLLGWQGVTRPRPGLDALLDVVERLQGAPLPVSILETEILSSRVKDYTSGDLDAVIGAGEVVWCGVEPLGERDGRIALYLTDHLPRLWRPPSVDSKELDPRERQVLDYLRERGASFFADVHEASGGGFPGQTVDALWSLVWKGLVTNDLFCPLRAFVRPAAAKGRRTTVTGRPFGSRRLTPPSAEGRWSLVETRAGKPVSETEWSAAFAQQLLNRYGVVTREVPLAEGVPGGFSSLYEVYRAFEESGRVRRGFFVAGVGAMQFAMPTVTDLLRALRDEPGEPEVHLLAATDPANPYGAVLAWPAPPNGPGRSPARAVGAHVVLVNGALAAYAGKGTRQLTVWLPEDEPDRSLFGKAIAGRLVELATRADAPREGFLVEEINGELARAHPLSRDLVEAGFSPSVMGIHLQRRLFPTRRGEAPQAAEGAGSESAEGAEPLEADERPHA